MLKKLVVALLLCVTAAHAMDLIEQKPFTVKEVEKLCTWELLKAIKPETKQEPEKKDVWKDLVKESVGSNQWASLTCDATSQRMAVTDPKVLSVLYENFHRIFGGQTFMLSCDRPVERWSSVKKLFVLLERLGAISHQDPKVSLYRKESMLQYALWQDDYDFAQYVIERGVDPNSIHSHGPLYRDARSGTMLELLEKKGAQFDSNPIDETHTLLHVACGRQVKADAVTFCLSRGMDPNIINRYGNTPLGVLAQVAWYEPLERVEPKLVALINAGADFDFKDPQGKTPCEIALAHKVHDVEGDPYYPKTVDRFVQLIKEAQVKK